ncbi:MAG: beta-ketoacyl-ACP synthase III [Candidatus Dormibacteraceae bacterium]
MATAHQPGSVGLPIRAFANRGRASVIVGLGVELPPRIVTNHDLERMVDTTDAWITKRTGIRQRHLAEPGTATWQLATAAARAALKEAGVRPEEVDLVMVASSSPDGPFPPMACRVQEQLGAHNAWAFDMLAACTGLLYELSIADAMIATGRAETILVIGAEVLSRIVDWTDRSTCVLLGDGAGAVLVRPATKGGGIRSWCLGADGREWNLLTYGLQAETGAYAAGEVGAHFRMKGPETYKIAVECFAQMVTAVVEAAGLGVEDVDVFVPHQANSRIVEAAARRVGIPLDRIVLSIDEHANVSTATIPLALHKAALTNRLHTGDRVLLASFGAGLTWAACLMEWEGA